MVEPALSKIMKKEKVNRYALSIATAKVARIITEEYVQERDYIEKNNLKMTDKAAQNIVNAKYRDEKAVQNAVEELYNDEFTIVEDTLPSDMVYNMDEDLDSDYNVITDIDEENSVSEH